MSPWSRTSLREIGPVCPEETKFSGMGRKIGGTIISCEVYCFFGETVWIGRYKPKRYDFCNYGLERSETSQSSILITYRLGQDWDPTSSMNKLAA